MEWKNGMSFNLIEKALVEEMFKLRTRVVYFSNKNHGSRIALMAELRWKS